MHGIVAAAFLAAIVGPAPRSTKPAVRREVIVTTTDYRFAMPAELPAGPTTFIVDNHGREAHHLSLVRLGGGHHLQDLLNTLRAGGPPPRWAVFVGGPNAVDPGAKSLPTTVDLAPGRYAAICMIPGPDGIPHVMKGMSDELTVRGSVIADHSVPLERDAADTITLTDYAFSFTHLPRPGMHRVVIRNVAEQPHELVLTRLAPGKSAHDVATWVEHMQGPPPAHFLGGVSPLSTGQTNVLTLDLTQGRYALLCFLPDAKDGKPHVAHGMMRDFEVKEPTVSRR